MKFDKRFFKKLYHCEKRISIPTCFTLLRFLLTPFIVIAIIQHNWSAAFSLFAVASLTDILDGGLARWWNDTTVLGACLDPLADKFLLISSFFALALAHPIPHWYLMLICLKETITIAGSSVLMLMGTNFTIAPTFLGKLTTLTQIIFIMAIFMCHFLHIAHTTLLYNLLNVIAGLIIITCAQYVHVGIKYLIARVIKL